MTNMLTEERLTRGRQIWPGGGSRRWGHQEVAGQWHCSTSMAVASCGPIQYRANFQQIFGNHFKIYISKKKIKVTVKQCKIKRLITSKDDATRRLTKTGENRICGLTATWASCRYSCRFVGQRCRHWKQLLKHVSCTFARSEFLCSDAIKSKTSLVKCTNFTANLSISLPHEH